MELKPDMEYLGLLTRANAARTEAGAISVEIKDLENYLIVLERDPKSTAAGAASETQADIHDAEARLSIKKSEIMEFGTKLLHMREKYKTPRAPFLPKYKQR